MRSIATEKAPGGKLVRIKADFDTHLSALQISGDFFLHPEESIESLERALLGLPATATLEELERAIDSHLHAAGAEMLGITPAALAHAIHTALTSPPAQESP